MIHKLEEYTAEIKRIVANSKYGFRTTTLPWFRGQSNESWELIPSLYRLKGQGTYERELVRDFKLNGNLKVKRQTNCNIESLFLMQHYGIPTRLLDWTESFLIALYFAVLDYKNKANSAVWVFFPWELNDKVLPKIKGFIKGDRTVPISTDKRLGGYAIDIEGIKRNISDEFPLAIRPVRTSERIIAQKGMFTIHGTNRESLNSIADLLSAQSNKKINLIKLVIDGDSKLEILRELYVSGITHSILFPELEGICQEIAFRYSDDFTNFNDGHKFFGFK